MFIIFFTTYICLLRFIRKHNIYVTLMQGSFKKIMIDQLEKCEILTIIVKLIKKKVG